MKSFVLQVQGDLLMRNQVTQGRGGEPLNFIVKSYIMKSNWGGCSESWHLLLAVISRVSNAQHETDETIYTCI